MTDQFNLDEFRARVQRGNDPQHPVRETMNRIGDRWTPLLLMILRAGVMRYMQLLNEINSMADTPISQRILTLKLRACERDGFVQRTVIPTVPPQVEYRLTALGEQMVLQLDQLICWLEDHSADIDRARHQYDQDHDS